MLVDKRETEHYSLMTWLNRPVNRLVCLVALVPVLLIFFHIQHNAVSVPFSDEWTSARLASKVKTGEWTLADLFRAHNEHRIFFTNLLTVILTYTTDWNIKYETYVSFTLACANLLMILWMLYEDDQEALTLGVIPIAGLVFSYRQHLNWLSGFLNCWYFCIFFLLLSLVVFKHGRVGWWRLGLGVFFALCSMFSVGAGLLVWIVLTPALWMLNYRKWQYGVFWFITAGISYLLYFTDSVPNSSAFPYNFDILEIFHFVLLYLANSFAPLDGFEWIGPWVGGLGILLWIGNLAYLKWNHYSWSSLAIWFTLGSFVIGTAVITAITRSDKNMLVAYSNRYNTLSLLFWVSIAGLCSMTAVYIMRDSFSKRGQNLLFNAQLLCWIPLLVFYIALNHTFAQMPPLATSETKACLVAYPVVRDVNCLRELSPRFAEPEEEGYDELIEHVDRLTRYKLAIFADYEPGEILPAYHYAARAYEEIELGHNLEALEFYRIAIGLYPQNAELYAQRGILFMEMGRQSRAFREFDKALEINPHHEDALRERGLINMEMGLYDSARNDFELLLLLDPTNTLAQEQIAILEQVDKDK